MNKNKQNYSIYVASYTLLKLKTLHFSHNLRPLLEYQCKIL